MNYIFVGCDSHDKTLVNRIAINREVAKTKKFGANRAGRQKLVEYLKGRSEEAVEAKIVLAYEASGNGFVLYDELKKAGMECHVLAPTKIERSTKQKRNKNDERDAERLVEILRSHYLAGTKMPSVWVPDVETRDNREPVRARQDLTEKLAKAKNQVQTLLKRNGMEKPEGIGKSWTKSYRQWVKGNSEMVEIGWGIRTNLSSLLRQMEFLEKEIECLDKALEDLAAKAELKPVVDALKKEAGVGLMTALKFTTDIGDFSRFKRGRQVGAFFGLAPSSNESGETADRKGHITREGSPSARKVLCQASWSRVQHDAEERKVYMRLVSRNPKKKKIALVACCRRLTVRLWHVGRKAQLEMKTATA